MNTNASSRREENFTFRALYLLAILFVVDGHTTLSDMFDLGHLFRYYSFHLMLFSFGAGYFFSSRGSILSDIAARAKKLLLPLYIWNFLYGLIAFMLRRIGGFEMGASLSLHALFLAPLTDGQHFVYNLGSWFLFPLFLCQVFYSLIRRISPLWKDREALTFVLCLIPGALAVNACHAGTHQSMPLFLMRALILLPGYAGGQLYRRILEKHDTAKTVPYLIVVVLLRALLCSRYENLAYLLSDLSYFPVGAFGVYAGGGLAIAFYLRIARLIAPYMKKSRLALYASRHTFDIMMHHFMGFFTVNCVFLVLHMLGIGAADFSVHAFRTQIDYNYAPAGMPEMNVLYLFAGMLLPLAAAFVTEKIKDALKK